jgi:hypothetical protein
VFIKTNNLLRTRHHFQQAIKAWHLHARHSNQLAADKNKILVRGIMTIYDGLLFLAAPSFASYSYQLLAHISFI